MTSKKHEFILRPIERNDLSEVNEMLRDGRMEIFPEFFKSEIIYNYKLQVVALNSMVIFLQQTKFIL